MRKITAILGATLLAIAFATPALAAKAGGGDGVLGAGYRLRPDGSRAMVFTVAAVAPRGHAGGWYTGRWYNLDLAFVGAISCFDVVGHEAVVGGIVTAHQGSYPGFQAGDVFLVFLSDRGIARLGQPSPDVVSQTYEARQFGTEVEVPADFPNACPDATTTSHDHFSVQGSVWVIDR